MKRLLSPLLALFLTLYFQAANGQEVSVSYQAFYDDLSPYGQWIDDPQYGNVWTPTVDIGFRPYATDGYWVMTNYGNTWVSDEPWGWACYHYGRWTYDPYYGWVWVPGYEWAPAWVDWRFGGGYCGWAPLAPGIAIGASFGCPDNWWVFVGPQYLYSRDFLHHWQGPAYNRNFINRTSRINGVWVDKGTQVHYNYGPRVQDIQPFSRQPVQVYRVSQGRKAGVAAVSGNTVNIYRPAVNRATITTARPANVIAAPHGIGKPQAVASAAHTAPFRQQLQQGKLPARGNAGTAGHPNVRSANQHTAGTAQRHVARQNPTRPAPHTAQSAHAGPSQAYRQPPHANYSRAQPAQKTQSAPRMEQQPRMQQEAAPRPMPQQHMEAPRMAAPPAPRMQEGGGRR